MKKLVLLFFCLLLGLQANAQGGFFASTGNLFTIGNKIQRAEDNFINLKVNVDRYADKKVKILKYEKVGLVKDSVQIVEFIKQNFLNAPMYRRGIVFDSTQANFLNKKVLKINLVPCQDSVSRNHFLESKDGEFFIKSMFPKMLPNEIIKSGDEIWKLKYSIEGKLYVEYDFIQTRTKKLFVPASFWGFASQIKNMQPIPLGNWVKSKVIGWEHSANDFFRKIPENIEHRNQTNDTNSVQWMSDNNLSNVLAPDEAIQENCKYATYTVYTPSNGDDIHVAVDVVWKQIGDEIKIVSSQIRLKGSLEKRAIFSKIFERGMMSFGYYKKKNQFQGTIMGNLYYFKGDQENKVFVNRHFELAVE